MAYKVDKKSAVIMNRFNFAVAMSTFFQYFLFLIIILCFPAISFSNNIESFWEVPEFSPFEQNGKFGIKNTKGEVLIPAEYDKLGWSNSSFSVIDNVTGYRINGQWGLIDLNNQKVTKADFDEIFPAEGSVLIAKKRSKSTLRLLTGCINVTGKVLVPLSYDGLKLSGMRAIVFERQGSNFRYGLIDIGNSVLVPLHHLFIYPLGSLRYAVVSTDNKTAVFSEDGKQLTTFSFDSVSSFKKNLAFVYQNDLKGLINRAGEIVLSPEYRDISFKDNGTVATLKPDAWLFLEGNNKSTRQYFADSVTVIKPGVLKVTIGHRTFITKDDFTPISEDGLSYVGSFSNGKALFHSGGRVGLINNDGSIAVPAKHISIIRGKNYLLAEARINNKARWLLLDSVGKQIAPKHYDLIDDFNGTFFPAKNKGFWGALNPKGEEIVACVHDSLIQNLGNLIVVKFKGLYGIINTKEDWIVTPQPNMIRLLDDQRYLEWANGNQFIKNMEGDVIYFTTNPILLKGKFLLEELLSGTVLKISMNGVILERFEKAESVNNIFEAREGFRAIKRDGRYGFIDDRSRLRIANRYEDVRSFSEGLAGVKILGKWGYITKDDKLAVQPVYDEIFPFENGFAIVKQKDFFGLIDKKGKVILPVRYESIELLPSKMYKVKLNGLLGLMDNSGQSIINPKFSALEDLNNNYIIVERDGKWGVITNEGLSTIPLVYDGLQFDRFSRQFIARRKSEWTTTSLPIAEEVRK